MADRDLLTIARHFRIEGEPAAVATVRAGHINDTYLLTTKHARYVLQRINHAVFEDPPRMTDNIIRVTEHIYRKVLRTDPQLAARQLMVVHTHDGEGLYRDRHGDYWRTYDFIECAVTHDTGIGGECAYEAARMFGRFQRMLIDLPGPPLHETIPGFHDTRRRFETFQEVLGDDVRNRAAGARDEIDSVFEHAEMCDVFASLVADGEIPLRVAHNDAKINNVMLDESTGRGVCVIDLDTVMPGLALADFGDLVRTATCGAAEDETDLSRLAVDATLFDAIARGFLSETADLLTPAEKQHIVFAGKLITYEQLIRFLTDYLAGDVYYKVDRENHNLDRGRTQAKLLASMLKQEQTLQTIVDCALR